MRKVLIAVAAFVVAWLAVSLVYGLFSGIVFNPALWIAQAMAGSGRPSYSTYTGVQGLIILVLTLVVAVRIYRAWIVKWGVQRADALVRPGGSGPSRPAEASVGAVGPGGVQAHEDHGGPSSLGS